MKIAITGANGLVGKTVVEILGKTHTFLPLLHDEVDLTQKSQLGQKLESMDFDLFLHMAAYTNVDGAEIEKDKARALNVDATKTIFDFTHAQGKKLIYLSTDFVFDGTNPPYDERSTPHPLGYYARTKFEGEEIVKEDAMIIRISYPYGGSHPHRKDFIEKIKGFLTDGKTLSMVSDASITPTYIPDIAHALGEKIEHFSPEIVHVVGAKSYSPLEIGQKVAQSMGVPMSQVKPISFQKFYEGKAPRPQYSEIISHKKGEILMKSFDDVLHQVTHDASYDKS